MSTPDILTLSEIQYYINWLEEGGINAVASIYQDLNNKGYGYAGWAYGVATGDSITGHGALDYMIAVRERSGQPALAEIQINDIRVDMLQGYLDALYNVANKNGGSTNKEIEFEIIKEFHQKVFDENNLSIEYWTLNTPMRLIDKYFGYAEVERIWQEMVQTNGTGLDALMESMGLLALVVEASQGVIYLDSSNNIITSVTLANHPELMSQVVRVIDTSTEAEEASKWVEALSGLRGEGSLLHYWAQKMFDEAVYSKVGDQDKSGQDDYFVLVNPITDSDRKNIVFGLGGKDVIYGASAQDHLYGGSADDNLYGKIGEDYLYGGSENDYLNGGENNDYLDGGSGNDILEGGEDNDILNDVSGDDTYVFNGNFGHDTIYDKDRQGQIKINGVVITAGEQQNPELWKSADGKYFISLQDDTDGISNSKKVVISVIGGDPDNQITVKYWKDGHLGLKLTPTVDTPSGTTITTGIGTSGDDYIVDSTYGGNERYYVYGFGGNDIIHLDDKNYNIYVGEGQRNVVITGNGNNGISSGLGSDQIFTGAGDDLIYLDSLVTRYDGSQVPANWSNFASSGAGQDFIMGGYGFDTIYAGDGADVFMGHGGSDRLLGEQGNDIIYGDGVVVTHYSPQGERYNAPLDIERAKSPHAAETDWFGLEAATNFAYHGNDHIYGGDGNDIIFAEGGSDTIYGGANDDIISGDSIRHVSAYSELAIGYEAVQADVEATITQYFYQYAGNDTIHGGMGEDIIYGGYKNDKLYGGDDKDIIYGDSDTASNFPMEQYSISVEIPSQDIYTYTWNLNPLTNTFRTDFYSTYVDQNNQPLWTADDSIEGGAGDDLLYGEEGNDTIHGGEGADQLSGDESGLEGQYHGNDTLYGDAGDDAIWGDGGSDTIDGGEGADQIAGDDIELSAQYHGSDTIDGGVGNDSIWGQGGKDTIHGGEGADRISGDDVGLEEQYHGNDTLYGDAGDDAIWGDGGSDTIDGGEGADQISGDDIGLDGQYHSGDTIDGGVGNDKIWGQGGKDTIHGGEGADQISGDDVGLEGQFHDNDTLYGDAGDDQIWGQGGNDTIYAGDGADRISGDELALDEQYHGNDIIYGETGDDYIWGNAGDDKIYGGDELDQLYGDGGDDVLDGGLDSDLLDGGAGNDQLDGGEGQDTYVFGYGYGEDHILNATIDTQNKDVIYLKNVMKAQVEVQIEGQNLILGIMNNTTDRLIINNYFSETDTINNDYWLHCADGSVTALKDMLTVILIGTEGNDVLTGSSTLENILTGLVGDDQLYGGNKNDQLYGGLGNDSLYGGAGNDILYSEEGRDTLVGGVGDDTYIISKGTSIIEQQNEGIDTVKSSMSYTLSDGLENLTLTGDAITGKGNYLDNTIIGNDINNTLSGGDGNDYLDGGMGIDKLIGGDGDDIYIINHVEDTPVERGNAGTDTVHSIVSFTLLKNLENLTLIGEDGINATGNDLSNVLIGK